jgi:hypothetical protein
VLSGTICVDRAAYNGHAPTHPFQLLSNSVEQTYRRIQHLDTLVDLSPGTFTQYQALQAKKWWSEIFPKSKKELEERHCDDDYFDTYQDFPVETGDHLFDAEQELEFDENENLCDVLNLDSIYKSRAIVDCSAGITCDPTQEEKDTQINLAPSERALKVLLDSAILSPVALATTDILAQIIFDTGASLAISPHRSDFDDDPTPLSRLTQLGGMGKGLQIEGIGTVVWTFNAKDGSEVQLRVRAYYVPGAKARLLSPQKLFDQKRGVFGHFHGDIEIHYFPKSGLPIAEAHCGPTLEHQVNLSVLDEENINPTIGQKLLLEWHYRFGHLNFASVQHLLRHVPLIARRFADAVKCDEPKCYVCQLAKQSRRPKKSS